MKLDPDRPVGFESRKAYRQRCESGFWERYITGPNVVDVGYRGGTPNAVPIVDGALGVEMGHPGYDGLHLPVSAASLDAIHASHVLEHVRTPQPYLVEWFSKLRIGGHLILFVPHAYLYERRVSVPPSQWSPEHLRSYTPAILLREIETALPANCYRIVHLADNDAGYDYSLPTDAHPTGCLEIECVIRRINPPTWNVEP